MKYFVAKLLFKIDKFIHKNFDFLNLNKKGQFGTNYEWIYRYLFDDIVHLSNKTFIEVGSRDAYDALGLIEKFNFSYGYIFEPSYSGIIKTIENLKHNRKFSTRITFFPFGLGDKNGVENFFEYRHFTKNDNIPNFGASNFNSSEDNDNLKYRVPIYELDNLNLDLSNNYLLVMDCEGSELSVLKGAKNSIQNTKYICLETSLSAANQIKYFLENLNFKLIDCDLENSIKGELPKLDNLNIRFNLLFQQT